MNNSDIINSLNSWMHIEGPCWPLLPYIRPYSKPMELSVGPHGSLHLSVLGSILVSTYAKRFERKVGTGLSTTSQTIQSYSGLGHCTEAFMTMEQSWPASTGCGSSLFGGAASAGMKIRLG